HVADHLGLLRSCHEEFARACRTVSGRHPGEPDVRDGLAQLAQCSPEAVGLLGPFRDRYGERAAGEPNSLREALFPAARSGAYGLLRDLHDLNLLATESHLTLTAVTKAAEALRDD